MGNFDLTNEDMKKINEEKLALAKQEIKDRNPLIFPSEAKEKPKEEEFEAKEEPKAKTKKAKKKK